MGSACGYCKKKRNVVMPVQAIPVPKITVQNVVEEKNIHNGYVLFYAGVRSDDDYTSPVLSIHLYKTSAKDITLSKQDQMGSSLVQQNVTRLEKKSTIEEEVKIIAVEDIFKIGFITDTKKSVEQQETTNTRRGVEEVKMEKCCKYCCDCWCFCKKEKRIPPPPPERETTMIEGKSATRVITITIEYSTYSHPETASNIEAFAQQQQETFFKDKFKIETLKFYLINNADFNDMNFDEKRVQADNLCRSVMQMKALKRKYPNEEEIQKIIHQQRVELFGEELK